MKILSEPQQSLVNKLKSGAKLKHDLGSGLFRLQDGLLQRSIPPATVQSLLAAGVVCKSLAGDCSLA
jgi:hypothetical protein